MNRERAAEFWRAAGQLALGGFALAVVTAVCLALDAGPAIATALYLMVVVVASLTGSFVPSILLSVVATLCLDYFFTPPLFRFSMDLPQDVVAVSALLGTGMVVSGLMSRVRRSLDELRASKKQLQLMIDTIPAPIWSSLPDGTLEFLNRRWLDDLGISQEEASRYIQVHPEDLPRLLEARTTAFATGNPFDHEVRLQRADGQYRWALLRALPLRDDSGKILRWYGVSTDIEDRKQVELALSERVRLLDLTHDSVYVRDMDGVITYWNRGAEERYGWKREEAIGQVSHSLMKTAFPEPLEEITSILLRTGRWEGELIHTTREGQRLTVASRWSLQQDELGRPVATLVTSNDISERKRAEEALSRTQAELAHVGRALTMGEMAASIAHEVNQPLAAIATNANASLRWLTRDPPNLEEVEETAQRIVNDAKRATEVIARIRSFVRKTDAERAPLDLNDAIREVVALAQQEIRTNRVVLRMDLANDLQRVLGDRVQLQQVVLNLVMNGVEAMSGVEDRPRELSIATRNGERDPVRVTVRDTGRGFDAESTDRLFDAFYSTKPGGMGMGLSISRSIVESHGGRLVATPNDGPGATFSFTLSPDA